MKTVVVTGAAGFIGSNIIKGLNARGFTRIIAVDDLRQGDKFKNIADLKILDYQDAADFYQRFEKKYFGSIEAVFHEGACSDTMENNGQYMMQNNFSTSCQLFEACQNQGTRLLYASSAATYGASENFAEAPINELPLNVYGYSKLLFDQRLRQLLGSEFEASRSQVAGFRYFNVYGPREQHKGRMASVAFHQFHQFKKNGTVQLFGSYGDYAAGEQKRDFVFIDDVVAVNLWFYDHPEAKGIFNLGSGRAQAFNDVALSVVNTLGQTQWTLAQAVEKELITYIDFPEALKGKYQSFTQADLNKLRSVGCEHSFSSVEQGVSSYMNDLQKSKSIC